MGQPREPQGVEATDATAQALALQNPSRAFSLPRWFEWIGAGSRFYARNVEIFGDMEPNDYLYKVVTGAVRTYKILSDGRRQVGDFYLAGEFFGLETGRVHAYSAEAITDTGVLILKRSVLMLLAETDIAVARQLLELTGCELERAQAHVTLLIKTAKERMADFLLDMERRSPGEGYIDLPMSRLDIADYLGLTIETVSRTLTDLEAAAVIALPNARRVVLRDRAALKSKSLTI